MHWPRTIATRVDKLVVSEAFIPGVTPSPPLFQPAAVPAATAQVLNARLWHLMFNQLPAEVSEALVRGREDIFFGAEFDASAGSTKLPAATVEYYVKLLKNDRDTLRGSFSFYRALSDDRGPEQGAGRYTRLQLPVLAIGGAESAGPFMRPDHAASRRQRSGHGRSGRPLGCRGGSRRDRRGADRVPDVITDVTG